MKIAVIGCGHWGKNLVRNFYELDALAAICDNNLHKVDSLYKDSPKISLYNDFNELVANPERKFTYVEMKFFSMWFYRQDSKT